MPSSKSLCLLRSLRPVGLPALLCALALAAAQPSAQAAQQASSAQPVPAATQVVPAAPQALDSPRLERLRTALAAGETTAAFWREVAASGAPLVEPGAHDREALVTFLWHGTPDTRSVKLSWAMRSDSDFALVQLEGSDVWFLTLRLPAGMRAAYQLVPDAQVPPGADRAARFRAEDAVAQPDPLNHGAHWPPAPSRAPVAAEATPPRSVLLLPGALQEPWVSAVADTLRGTVVHERLSSQRLGNTRDISIYLPPGAAAAQTGVKLPLVLLFDREAYLDRTDTPALLDALIAQGRIPPTAVAFVSNPSRALRATELTANPEFSDFLAQELMPWLRARHPHLSPLARDVVVAGSSYGGLAAAAAALRHPQVFGNVLALSGSFWWGPQSVPHQPGFDRWGEGEWLTRQYAAQERLPLRFFITAGLMELGMTGDSGGGILETSRHLRTVLQVKGYPVHYQELPGGHDYYAWRGELAQGLIALLGP